MAGNAQNYSSIILQAPAKAETFRQSRRILQINLQIPAKKRCQRINKPFTLCYNIEDIFTAARY